MSNQCSTVEPGLGGCCCNTDACLNPVTNTFPGNDLICYVGIYYEKDNYSVGSEVKCNGKCASLQTTFAGKKFKSYHCAPTPVCKALAVDNSCGPVYKDSDVTACCCDSGKNCNVKEPISTNATAPAVCFDPSQFLQFHYYDR
ncbi:ET module [Ancylostoma duodenale]|uniref:ET module n=1 Tax=Ancylostoma duodenale TaxID=51022 RepID=A0A0C2GQ24_9BILA|nr:ET module [Ancylostoma duodenale]